MTRKSEKDHSYDEKIERELAEIKERREAVAEKMYWARHDGTKKEERERLNREWNDLRSKEAELRGEKFTPKFDRRDDFRFERKPHPSGDGTVTVAKGRISDPDTTINWREDTRVGMNREKAVRRSVSGGTGDDAGHIAPAIAGTDPEGVNAGGVDPKNPNALPPSDRLNYVRQNSSMNRGSYRNFENEITRKAKEGQGDVDVEIHSRTFASRFEGQREHSRRIVAAKNGEKADLSFDSEKVTILNPSSPKQRSAAEKDSSTIAPRRSENFRRSQNVVIDMEEKRKDRPPKSK